MRLDEIAAIEDIAYEFHRRPRLVGNQPLAKPREAITPLAAQPRERPLLRTRRAHLVTHTPLRLLTANTESEFSAFTRPQDLLRMEPIQRAKLPVFFPTTLSLNFQPTFGSECAPPQGSFCSIHDPQMGDPSFFVELVAEEFN